MILLSRPDVSAIILCQKRPQPINGTFDHASSTIQDTAIVMDSGTSRRPIPVSGWKQGTKFLRYAAQAGPNVTTRRSAAKKLINRQKGKQSPLERLKENTEFASGDLTATSARMENMVLFAPHYGHRYVEIETSITADEGHDQPQRVDDTKQCTMAKSETGTPNKNNLQTHSWPRQKLGIVGYTLMQAKQNQTTSAVGPTRTGDTPQQWSTGIAIDTNCYAVQYHSTFCFSAHYVCGQGGDELTPRRQVGKSHAIRAPVSPRPRGGRFGSHLHHPCQMPHQLHTLAVCDQTRRRHKAQPIAKMLGTTTWA